MQPDRPKLLQVLERAMASHQAGNLPEAERHYRAVLQASPNQFDALHYLGVLRAQRGHAQDAVKLIQQALSIDPQSAEANANLGNVLLEAGRAEEAATHLRKALAIQPRNVQTLYTLGNALRDLKQHNEALGSYDAALSIDPRFFPALNNRGDLLKSLDRFQDALASFERALAVKPDEPGTLVNIGIILRALNRHEQALASYERALALNPGYAEALYNRGNALLDLNRHEEALASYRKALALKPDHAEAHNNLGNALREHGRLDDAFASYRNALSCKPDYAEVYSNIGNAQWDQGRLDDAIASYRKALSLKPDYAVAHSNLLFAMQFCLMQSPSKLMVEYERFAAQFEAPLKAGWRQHQNRREPGRRLKVGYVSPDFRRHAVAYFIEPALANHDKDRFEVCCYYNHAPHDEFTDRLAGYADGWLDCKSMSDAQLAERIRADGIDILVDLAGHTAHNRILTFARKPAPIQITYLGYPGTSGLSAMDYRLTDGCADPQGSEAYYTEKLLRLPDSLWCYRPRKEMPETAALPAQQNGYITFGSFNNFNKIDGRCIELWAQLLQAVPNSRLLMVTVPEGESRHRLTAQFAAQGVAPERLEFHGKLPANEFHRMLQRADMTLDPVTVNGATTTCESLWLGVPVISLVGTRFLERAGFSILSAAGLHEFAATTPQGCIKVAVRLAENLPQMAAFRSGLRARVAASPLVDEAKFTRNLEKIYRDVWTEWCSTVT
jgi:predicted O-linked N-acetylglucosamine transferase (SPINDLY family)